MFGYIIYHNSLRPDHITSLTKHYKKPNRGFCLCSNRIIGNRLASPVTKLGKIYETYYFQIKDKM